MNLIPDTIEKWKLDTINELVKLRDVESEDFDFKGTDIRGLTTHLCAFANTHGGFTVLGIDEIKNNKIITGFEKNGFKIGMEDEIKKEIRNYQVQIDPTPELQIKTISEDKKFFVVIKIENNKFNKPYFIKEKGICYVRIGSSSTPASRNTIIELFSDVNKQIQDLENLKASILLLKEDFILTIDKFRYVSSAAPNRLAKLDLTLFRNNIVRCQSFLIEKKFLGQLLETRTGPIITPILHTLDTLNSYIDGFSNSTDVLIKGSLQSQIEKNASFTLSSELEYVVPFLDDLLAVIEEYLSKIS